jgi:hypothetical protein
MGGILLQLWQTVNIRDADLAGKGANFFLIAV